MLNDILKENLKRYCTLLKVKQKVLAKRSGVEISLVRRISAGRAGVLSEVSLETVEKLATALGIDAFYLLEAREKSTSYPITDMPAVDISESELAKFGRKWTDNGHNLSRTPPHSSGELCKLFDRAVGEALRAMFSGIKLVEPKAASLLPSHGACVEVGPVQVVGGIRPQNFDAGYRPDGVRIVFDSKSLNSKGSVRKNWKNMVNDLATEATTVHSRFPHALVTFMVIIPEPCFVQREAIIQALSRINGRDSIDAPNFLAEAVSLVIWNPDNGTLHSLPAVNDAGLGIGDFPGRVHKAYVNRYSGFPPHADLASFEDEDSRDV